MCNVLDEVITYGQSDTNELFFSEYGKALHVGMVFKNYNEMCRQLQLQPTTGKARQLQFKELGRFCAFHKEGHQIIVDEVFDVPKLKIDGRQNNRGKLGNSGNSVYGELMDVAIIDMLLCNRSLMYGTVLSFSDIFMRKIAFLSDTYGQIYNMGGAHVYALKKGLSVELVTEYLVKTREILKKCFETALNRLQRKGIIQWRKCFVIKTIGSEAEVATNEQEVMIKRCEEEAYEKLERDFYDRIKPGKNRKFKELVVEKLQKISFLPIDSYWTGYEIYFDQEDYELECDIEEILQELQELLVKRVHKAVINKSCMNEKTGERFTPYKADTHLRSINMLDFEIWNELSETFKDDLNQEFARYIRGNFGYKKEYLVKNEKSA